MAVLPAVASSSSSLVSSSSSPAAGVSNPGKRSIRIQAQKIDSRGDVSSRKTTQKYLQATPSARTASAPAPAQTQTHRLWRTTAPQPGLQERTQKTSTTPTPTEGERIWEMVETIRAMFRNLNDGEISVSAYDTAWVARVPALDGSGEPQFPKCLEWIKNNQLEDGSWGDKDLFLTYDRISGTLACAIALRTWNTGEKIVQKALEFIRRTMPRMEIEDSTHMPIGFEIVFPAMMEEARELELDINYDAPALQTIEAERQKKLQKIPIDVLHNHPTTLLHSLEGLHKMIDWNKVIKFQSPDGSLLASPASTACALMYTGNEKCLEYLTGLLEKFNDAVPNVYPVDLFERLWMVDRTERLGISRYFSREIKEALSYVYRYYTEKGIAWARNEPVQDLDDTSMAFRLLRTHGYDLSPDVFENFRDGDSFFCFAGQAGQAVTGMFNFYRASQVMFPGENVLRKGRAYARTCLEEKRKKNQLYDKWIISKDLPGEVKFGLDYAMHKCLERMGTRTYIDQYAADDVWIGKSLYRLPCVNNNVFLELAKADFNICQLLHRKEFQQLEKWYERSSFSDIRFSHNKLVQAFFGAAATLFEPELAPARLIWSQCWFMASVMREYFETRGSIQELQQLATAVKRWDPTSMRDCSIEVQVLFQDLHRTVQSHSKQGFLYQGRNITDDLRKIWEKWISSLLQKTEWKTSGCLPALDEYLETSSPDFEPAVRSTVYFVGERLGFEEVKNSVISKTMNTAIILSEDVQSQKHQFRNNSVGLYMAENPEMTEEEVVSHLQTIADEQMQLLVHETFRSTSLPRACRQLFLDAVRITNLFQVQDSLRTLDKLSDQVQRVLFQPAV